MKYMHFNSACSYAGLANMLEPLGHDTEDYQIALDMGLPYFLRQDKETGVYQAGPMLQSAEWFDLYLRPRGFCYIEKRMERKEVTEYLRPGMMLGIQVTPQSKHAVVCVEKQEDRFTFLNNKWEESIEEDRLDLSARECMERLPEQVVVGYLETCKAEAVDVISYYEESICNWEKLRDELQNFVFELQSPEALPESMNRLFRPLLLDGLSMMKLLGKQELVKKIEVLQRNYLTIVRENQAVRPADEFDCGELDKVIDEILELIREKLAVSEK